MATLSKRGRNELRDVGGGVFIGDKSFEDKNELLFQVCVQLNVQNTIIQRF